MNTLLFAVLAVLFFLTVYLVFFLLHRVGAQGARCSRWCCYRLCRRLGLSFRERETAIRLLEGAAQATPPAAAFGSFEMLARIIDGYIAANSRAAGHDEKLLSGVFDLKLRVDAGILLGGRGLGSTYALPVGTDLVLRESSGRILLGTLSESGQGYLSFSPDEDNADTASWKGGRIEVSFRISGDSGYSFASEVLDEAHSEGEPLLFLRHSSTLRRVQERRFHRKGCSIPVRITREDKSEFSASIIDISMDGFSVKSDQGTVVGDAVSVLFSPDGGSVLRLRADTVGHCGERYRFRFVDISREARNRIGLFVFTR